MQPYKTYAILWLLTASLCANEYTHLCFTSTKDKEVCPQDIKHVLKIEQQDKIEESIYAIQNFIRKKMNKDREKKYILYAKGFDATLLFMAQVNLLPYYRQNILGLILQETPANLYLQCLVKKNTEYNEICKFIDNYQVRLEGKASKEEVFKSLSPALQLDWYQAKIILIEPEQEKRDIWEKVLLKNGVHFSFRQSLKIKIKEDFPRMVSTKLKPKQSDIIPTYNGPILRYHLWKIAYKSSATIISNLEQSYGKDKAQKYDVFYLRNAKKNPVLFYIHGGGWTGGDKKYFHAICQQYADQGFSTVSINYRLLDLPMVGMQNMVDDIKSAIQSTLKKANKYHIDPSKTLIMAESAGAQLAFLASNKLAKENVTIKVAIFNSITSDLRLHSKKKQIRLSGIPNRLQRELWLDQNSPLHNLDKYQTMTLGIHSLTDSVVPSKHLEDLEIHSIIHHENIETLWLNDGMHPLSPQSHALDPSYSDIESKIKHFIYDNIAIRNH